MALGFDDVLKVSPGLAQSFIRTGVDGAHDIRAWDFSGLYPADGLHRAVHGDTDFEIEDAGSHSEVMRKDRTFRADTLALRCGDDFVNGRAHHFLNLITRHCDVDHGGGLSLSEDGG